MMEDWGALVDKQEKTLVDKVQMFIYQILFLISVWGIKDWVIDA